MTYRRQALALAHDDITWCAQLIEALKYKPGWTFAVAMNDATGLPMLDIRMEVPDSRGSGRIVSVYNGAVIPPPFVRERNERRFWDFVRFEIRKLEEHEMDEWIRVNGELVFDPHAPKTDVERSRLTGMKVTS